MKLICEVLDTKLSLVKEAKEDGKKQYHIEGVFLMGDKPNKNGRVYESKVLAKEVARYNEEFVSKNRALGELEHPQSATVNSERACHLITELKMDGNLVKGKSKILRTPMGEIMRTLIQDGVKMGMSSRALGQLENKEGVNHVENMKLITIDCVADPSAPGAFVNGILESKSFIVKQDGRFEEVYDQFEGKLSKLPRKDVDLYLREQIIRFINNLK